jgi:integrase
MKETMGFGLRKFKEILKGFDRFFIMENVTELFITQPLIAKWRTTCVNDSDLTIYGKYSVISQFCRYMTHLGYPCYAPRLPKMNFGDYVPYVFTHEQIRSIFLACDAMVMSCNNMAGNLFAIPLMLRLLYSTGMRVGEAVSLRNNDVDFEHERIVIRKTKNRQQRLIPLNPSMLQVLCQYRDARSRLPLQCIDTPNGFFFISPSGQALNNKNVYTWFKKILKKCGIPHIGKNHGPRVHDLRHTCAVHSLISQVRNGADIYCVLPVLSVFLGHKSLSGTERYVRLTQEMYPDIIKSEQSVSSFVFPSLPKMETDYEK